jgi:hypothetical protein
MIVQCGGWKESGSQLVHPFEFLGKKHYLDQWKIVYLLLLGTGWHHSNFRVSSGTYQLQEVSKLLMGEIYH